MSSQLRTQVFDAYGPYCEWPDCSEAGKELAHLHSKGMGGRQSADTVENVMVACWLHARVTDGEGSGNPSFFSRRIDPAEETFSMFERTGYSERLGAKVGAYRLNQVSNADAGLAWHRAEALRLWLEKTRPFRIHI